MRFIPFLLAVLVIVGGSVAALYAIVGRPEKVDQPIAFNHAVHINAAALECDTCHTDAATSRYAGLPGKDICLGCHDIDEEEDDTNPDKMKLFTFVEIDEDIPWERVALVAPDVFFSHRRHVSSAQLNCLECHADQPALARPPSTANLVMKMDDCIQCHENNGVSTDCLVCHR